MSRYYADLHDRELLTQAETIMAEVQRRKLADVFLPLEDCSLMERNQSAAFPRRFSRIAIENSRLMLVVERDFFRPVRSASATAGDR